jgi:hypothetical protein
MPTAQTRIRKYTTLADLEKNDKGSVYVLNSTEGTLEGNIVISIPKMNGNGQDLIRVPKTFIPIDVSQQASRQQLISSSEFRKTVGKGLIKLVTPEYAELLLAEPEAKEEQKRLVAEANKARSILKGAGVVEETKEEDEDEYIEVSQAKKEAKKAVQKKVAVKPSPKVEELVATAKLDNMNGTAVVAKLKNVRKMTRTDLKFLADSFPNSPRVIKYLKERLADLKTTEKATA